MSDELIKQLEGKTINRILVSADEEALAFETDQGLVAFSTEGDCCSNSWFSDLTGVDALIGGKVIDAAEIEMPEYNVEDGRTRQEFDSAYGYKVVTDKGRAQIVFRNSSNGYYGGWMAAFSEEITDDWQA